MTPEERFDTKWHKEDRGWITACWIWDAGKTRGYGRFWNGERQMQAHQFSYEREVGSVPSGLELDHLCRVHDCVNASHLEPVTHKENCDRGEWPSNQWRDATHCEAGHEFTPENTRLRNDKGWKICRACDAERAREYRRTKRDDINKRRRERRKEKKDAHTLL